MITFTNRIWIAADPEDVFHYLADPTRLSDGNYYVLRVTPLTDGPPRAGSRYVQQRRTDRQTFEIAELDAPSRVTLQALDGQRPAFTRTFRVAPHGHQPGAVVLDDWKLDTGHPPGLQRLGQRAVQHGVQANLGKLKQLLETSTVTLQDGRTVTLADHARARRELRRSPVDQPRTRAPRHGALPTQPPRPRLADRRARRRPTRPHPIDVRCHITTSLDWVTRRMTLTVDQITVVTDDQHAL